MMLLTYQTQAVKTSRADEQKVDEPAPLSVSTLFV